MTQTGVKEIWIDAADRKNFEQAIQESHGSMPSEMDILDTLYYGTDYPLTVLSTGLAAVALHGSDLAQDSIGIVAQANKNHAVDRTSPEDIAAGLRYITSKRDIVVNALGRRSFIVAIQGRGQPSQTVTTIKRTASL